MGNTLLSQKIAEIEYHHSIDREDAGLIIDYLDEINTLLVQGFITSNQETFLEHQFTELEALLPSQ